MSIGKDDFLEEVYGQLHAIARQRMAHEKPGHTLQATALVNEVYLKLQGHPTLANDRGRFFATAAEAMRRILIDHARAKGREKRGGGVVRRARADVADVADLAAQGDPEEILALDEAIRRLEGQDRQAADVVKLRFFAGLSVEETAEAMKTSARTVKRDWQ